MKKDLQHEGPVSTGDGGSVRPIVGVREMAELFQQFAGAEHHVLWVLELRPHERVSFVSAAFEPLFGRKPAELYADPRVWSEAIHADDRPGVMAVFEPWLQDPWTRRYNVEYRIVRSDGQVRWIHDVGHLPPGAMVPLRRVIGIGEDITERKLAQQALLAERQRLAADVAKRNSVEEALLASQARLAAVVANMTEGLIVCNVAQQRYEWNQAALAMHELEAQRAGEITLAEAIQVIELSELDGRPVPHENRPMARVLRGDTLRGHVLRVRNVERGWEKVFSYNGSRVAGSDGRPLLGLLECSDITAQRLAEEQVARLNADLELRVAERTAELRAAIKELEAFTYSVSHDLRAPLRALDGFSALLAEEHGGVLPGEARRYVGFIRDSAQRMGQLIDDLLDFSRLNRASMTRRRVQSTALVRHAWDSLEHQRAGRAVELRLGMLPDCEGDPALLRQVWVNLLSNAIKYTRGRAPAIIEVSSVMRGEVVEYCVRDNGVGFDMRYVHKLFGVFERLHRSEEFEGTGVGLAIVQRIVQRHGGQVRAESHLGESASFYFTLA